MALDGGQLRAAGVALMERTVADEAAHGNWTYRAVRPQEIITSYTGQSVEADCSDGCRCLARVVGVLDDPAGNDYAPFGNSSSFFVHLHHIELSDVKPFDIFTFGYWNGERHACMAWEKFGPGIYDWYVWNHGEQGQPQKRKLTDEMANHSGMTMTACLLNVPPDLPDTPQEKLQAATGFYAWVAWRLGEGPWKKYGQTNPKVRPNVPLLISPAWWKALAKFLLARKKPNS